MINYFYFILFIYYDLYILHFVIILLYTSNDPLCTNLSVVHHCVFIHLNVLILKKKTMLRNSKRSNSLMYRMFK